MRGAKGASSTTASLPRVSQRIRRAVLGHRLTLALRGNGLQCRAPLDIVKRTFAGLTGAPLKTTVCPELRRRGNLHSRIMREATMGRSEDSCPTPHGRPREGSSPRETVRARISHAVIRSPPQVRVRPTGARSRRRQAIPSRSTRRAGGRM